MRMRLSQLSQAKDSRLSRLFKNTALLSVGRLGSKFLVFFLVRFYTYILTNDEYGTADLITSAANFCIPIACAGLSCGFFRFAADAGKEHNDVTCFSSGLVILLAATAIFAVLSPLLSLFPLLSPYIGLILLYIIAANFHYFVTEFIRAKGMYLLFSLQGLINTGLNILFNLLFLLPLNLGLYGFVLSVIAADFLTGLFVFFYARLWRNISFRDADRHLIRQILGYCLPLIPATLCWWITNTSDRYMVSAFCGEGENGLYAAAYKIPNLLTIVCNMFLEAWQFSAITERQSPANEQNLSELSGFFSQVFNGYSAFLFVGTAGLTVFSPLLAFLLFDPSFASARYCIPILLVSMLFSALSNFYSTIYMIEKKGVPPLLTSALAAGLNIGLNLWLIPLYGAIGAAIATAASYGFCLVLRMIDTRRFLRFPLHPARFFCSVLLIGGMAYVMTFSVRGWIYIGGACCLLCLIINAYPFAGSVIHLLKSRKKA